MVITPEAVFAATVKVMSRPWVWGEADCCTASCDVFAGFHGFDPMLEARGRYRSERGAYLYIARRGGFEQMLADMLPRQGFHNPAREAPGDLALVVQDNAFGAALAICIQPGEWASKTETGHAILSGTRVIWSCRRP